MHFLSILTQGLDVLCQVFVNAELVALLFTHHINLLAQLAILSLNVVVSDQGLVKVVLKQLYLVLILAHDGCWGSDSLKLFFFLLELLNELLVLILEYHQSPNRQRLYQCSPKHNNIKCKLDAIWISDTYFFSCSNFLVKLSASRWSR